MLQKLKTQIAKEIGQVQNQQQTQQSASQPEVVTFSLARMDEFSHEELQQVIVRYDGQVKKLKALSQEKDQRIRALEQKVEQVITEQQSIEEMLNLRSGEIDGLKHHVKTFMTENDSLKRLVQALEHSSQQNEDLEIENQQFKIQIDDLRNLNSSLATGDAESIYRGKYDMLLSAYEQLKSEDANLRQSLQRSNESLSQLAQESEDLELSLQKTETQIQKKDKLIEQLKQRQCQFLDEKQVADDKIAQLNDKIKRSELMTKQIGNSNDTVLTEHAERIRGKDLVIQDLNSQIRQISGKISSMNEKEIYYKRQIETLQRTVYELQQEKQSAVTQKLQVERISNQVKDEQPLEGINDLMNQLLEIQGSPAQKSTTGDASSTDIEQLSEQKDNKVNQEIHQLRLELSELHQQYQELKVNFEIVNDQRTQGEIHNQELEQKLKVQIELVQELERRRSMARKEVKLLLLKTPNIKDQIQKAGLLQLRVLKKDLQQLYKDLLMTEDKTQLEKAVNDMIFNVQDCIQEAELASDN